MDIKKFTISLLQRPEVTVPLLVSGIYQSDPLIDDLCKLSTPQTPLAHGDLITILCKYLHAYVHPGSHTQSISLGEITRLFDQFANRRHGAASLENRLELRRKLLDYGFAICMLADLPKTGHILWDILTRDLSAAAKSSQDTFVGIDIGSGTGVLMLGMWLMAKRSGFASCNIVGLERNKPVAERTGQLMAGIGIGEILLGDAKRPETIKKLCRQSIHFVANETLPSQGHRLWKEDFLAINELLFAECGHALANTLYFPSAVYAFDSHGGKQFRLGPENKFQPDADYPLRLMRMAGIELSGHPILLEHVGSSWREFIAPDWIPRLAHRW